MQQIVRAMFFQAMLWGGVLGIYLVLNGQVVTGLAAFGAVLVGFVQLVPSR